MEDAGEREPGATAHQATAAEEHLESSQYIQESEQGDNAETLEKMP